MDLFTKKIAELYGNNIDILKYQTERYNNLIALHKKNFNLIGEYFFSAPGRVELSGNHTDHNAGKVLTAAVNLDTIGTVNKTGDKTVTLYSEGYKTPFVVDLQNLDFDKKETGTTNALIRGVARGLKDAGYIIGGFNATITSNVLVGSGLSSSASIEILLGSILNYLFNENKITPMELAKTGQFAENVYFGKPCGLMDQSAIAYGGVIKIDFKNLEMPVVEKVDFDFSETGYQMVVVNTGGNHEDLTDDYASIPSEMKSVAKELGKEVCREIDYEALISNIKQLRSKLGDRAVLRALHFLEENERVENLIDALRNNNFESFLAGITDSGNSSFKWLQNIYSPSNPRNQSVSLALAITEKMLNGKGTCRVHGGGFAGTILVFLPYEMLESYKEEMEAVFGRGCVIELSVRKYGPFGFRFVKEE